ncbi:MAG: hypothetical protein R3F30_03195 [Planctomycetota bacterium]
MRTLLPLIALAIPAGLGAQTNMFWLPKGAEKTQTAIYDQSYFGYPGYDSQGNTAYTPIHVQNGYATADAPVAAAKISAVWFRRNNFYGNSIYASSTDLAVHMSTNAADTASWSTTFANNEGTNRIQVFGSGGASKTVNWPADPYVNNGQQPVPFAHKIPFDTAFVFVQSSGKSVCLDYYITKRLHTFTSGTTTYHTSLLLDADGKAVGTRLANGNPQSSCKFSDGKYNSSLGYTTAGLTDSGGTWYLNYGSILASAPGVATLSGFGVDTKPNPFGLPIDMTPLGAPSCYWCVGLETGFGSPATPTAAARPMADPDDPARPRRLGLLRPGPVARHRGQQARPRPVVVEQVADRRELLPRR